MKDFTGNIAISSTTVYRNKREGMTAEEIFGTLTAIDTQFINNSANGLEILESSFLSCNVTDSTFDNNAKNGLVIKNGTGEVEFQNITAVLNTYSGVRIHDGKVSSDFRFSNLSNNREDGCSISNQVGAHQLFNCTASSNLRHGVSLFDPRHYNPSPRYYFTHFSLIDSTVNDNIQYGVRLAPGLYRRS